MNFTFFIFLSLFGFVLLKMNFQYHASEMEITDLSDFAVKKSLYT